MFVVTLEKRTSMHEKEHSRNFLVQLVLSPCASSVAVNTALVRVVLMFAANNYTYHSQGSKNKYHDM
jgi:hypothetical protein